ncbi:MAG: autoinducer 2-degrading protein [Patiriisocius sp.]|jgi:autoinducer 2-degrading protein
MLTRIVKMEFREEKVASFLADFEIVKHKIRHVQGCLHLDLLRDRNDPTIFFTYSKWEQENDLENYRRSSLFKDVWATTKPMFRSKASAWSVDTPVQVP